jgi:hypothetical protein
MDGVNAGEDKARLIVSSSMVSWMLGSDHLDFVVL